MLTCKVKNDNIIYVINSNKKKNNIINKGCVVMIKVVRENWTCDKGFTKKVYEFKENGEMQLIDLFGVYGIQVSEFKSVTADWNCDGDVYEMFGAYFDVNGRKNFITPEDIVSFIEDEGFEVVYNK